jgi:nucleotide-binding universal stress UspA family protein
MPRRRAQARIEAMDDRPILICFDGSEGAERAIETAASLLGRRRAVVLDVAVRVTVAEGVVADASLVPRPGFQGLHAGEAGRTAHRGAELAIRAGLDAEPRALVSSHRWEGIVEVADELDAAAIVIGSRGLSGLRELTHGSLSHDVAAHAHRPVLIVPPPA